MKIYFGDEKVRRAIAVLDLVKLSLSTSQSSENVKCSLYVDTYLNGREMGFSILARHDDKKSKGDYLKFWFSEHRTSDSLVVYWQKTEDYPLGDSLTDEAYNNAKCFTYPGHEDAARFIVDMIRDTAEKI